MGILPYLIIFIISLITAKRFHAANSFHYGNVKGVYVGQTLIHIPEDIGQLKILLHPDKAGRQHELLEVLFHLSIEPSVFPDKKLRNAVYSWLQTLHNYSHDTLGISEVIPYHTPRGWGGVVVDTGFGKYVYVIGLYHSLKNHIKQHVDTELIEHIDTKIKRRNSTNLVVCSLELHENTDKISHHGFGQKIDFIGCIFVQG